MKHVADYAETLFDYERKSSKKITTMLKKTSENWDVDRFSMVDNAILRIAMAEMLNSPDVPGKVIINEALEIARAFSSDESIPFINGILDKVFKKWGNKKDRIKEIDKT